MAEKSGSDETPLELRQKISRSRELVVRDMGGLRYELNFPLKFKRAFQRNTLVWVGAALTVGLLIALLARPQRSMSMPPARGPFAEQEIAGIRHSPRRLETRPKPGPTDRGEFHQEADGAERRPVPPSARPLDC